MCLKAIKALSVPYHSLIRHDLFDVPVEERDDHSLTVNTDVFSCAICEGNHARAVTVYFLDLKPNQFLDKNPHFTAVFIQFLKLSSGEFSF